MSASPSPGPSTKPGTPTPKHATNATDKQRAQLERLLKDPAKPAYIPPPPKDKTIRPPREMMKNVQGSSAGAGSGEFHVYKASRRREYERLKMLEEEAQKETLEAEFERKKREREEAAAAKTNKNRAKRQKKKERTKVGKEKDASTDGHAGDGVPLKKRRLVNGAEVTFKRPGEESDDEDEGASGPQPADGRQDEGDEETRTVEHTGTTPLAETHQIVIHEDD
ncbi:DUF1168-domain-containing protein [Punctularia strigosozonata HHB-11173 SS5]|uniref:DUF1168-domain-containing protein n=1 Tax=Punctularia strigosozonata (strain HHB-11173) TaxID=741275 RepID=UPI0004416FC4|nr:DUF1168-domain-containing protein [Punctularia strigosozonata HHB-11173 SS5]EIN11318.1 DUF1168-domain-containing protein [Punctularia strigosozonata HHB-11173 SS5]